MSNIFTTFLINTASAQGIVPPECARATNDIVNRCSLCQLAQTLVNATEIMITLAIPLAVIMIAFAGIMFAMSGGSQKRVSQAKAIVTAAVIGLAIVLGSWIIVNTFFELIGFGGWSNIDCSTINELQQ